MAIENTKKKYFICVVDSILYLKSILLHEIKKIRPNVSHQSQSRDRTTTVSCV